MQLHLSQFHVLILIPTWTTTPELELHLERLGLLVGRAAADRHLRVRVRIRIGFGLGLGLGLGLDVGRDRQANEHGEDTDVVDEETPQQAAAPPRHLARLGLFEG